MYLTEADFTVQTLRSSSYKSKLAGVVLEAKHITLCFDKDVTAAVMIEPCSHHECPQSLSESDIL